MSPTAKWALWIAGGLFVVAAIVLLRAGPIPFPGMTTAETWGLIMDGTGATIALTGLGVVWYQLYRHRIERKADSARQRRELEVDHDRRQKQATIEYTSNLRHAWLTARRKLWGALGKGALTEVKLARVMADQELEGEVKLFLSSLEELAVGANTEVFDRDVIGMLCGSFLIGVYDDFELFIRDTQKDGPAYYMELESLVRYFKDKRKPAPGPKVKGIADNWPQE